MTRTILLKRLRAFTEEVTADLIMPTRLQKGDTEQIFRPAKVYLTRLPEGTSATKKAPYVLHQVITGMDQQPQGQRVTSSAKVRSICCVYNDDEQEGGLMLLNLMERLRIAMLRQVVIGGQFTLDLEAGLETLVYPDDTAPYFVGEMISTWKLPPWKERVTYERKNHRHGGSDRRTKDGKEKACRAEEGRRHRRLLRLSRSYHDGRDPARYHLSRRPEGSP